MSDTSNIPGTVAFERRLLEKCEAKCDRLIKERDELRQAATDALAGWRYIRMHHGDLPGVGWERVENKLATALANLNKTDGE